MTQEEYYEKWLVRLLDYEAKEEKALDNDADLLAEYYRGIASEMRLMLNDFVKLNIPDVIKSVCPRCEGTGNVGKHNDRFVDCVNCKGTGRTVL